MEVTSFTIRQAHEALKNKTVSASELTAAFLDRMEKRNPDIFAYLRTMPDEARAQAKEADTRIALGEPLGMLTGIPLAIKDNILLRGHPCTAASKILAASIGGEPRPALAGRENYIASYDATVIARLKKEGAVFLGKTNMDEFAMGSSTENSAFGKTKNPRDTSRVPGGSSGGSAAAVADDLCVAALGSDTGGSIRQPASFCGIVGLKPTYGAVSRSGLMAMASSLDQIGPLAKTVEDAEILFRAIAGYDPLDATTHPNGKSQIPNPVPAGHLPKGDKSQTSEGVKGLKIGIPKEYFAEGLDGEVRKVIEGAIRKLEELGAEIREVSLPHSAYALAVYYLIMPAEVSANLARFDGIRYGYSILNPKSKIQNPKPTLSDVYLESRGRGFGDEVRRRIMLGTYALSSGYYDAYYLKAQKVRAIMKRDFDAVFREVDVLATPTSPTVAFEFGERAEDPLSMYLADVYTVSVNLAGIPALSMPAGNARGLPVGLQLIGQEFSEPLIFRAAKALEAALVTS